MCSGRRPARSQARRATVTPQLRTAKRLPRMAIARDHDVDAALAGESRVHVVDVEPIRLAVDFERDAVPGRALTIASMSTGYPERFRIMRPVSGR